jgi:hypothetical protein
MFAYILGTLLFGWYGLFLGPMVLVFVTHFLRVVVPELLPDESANRPTAPVYLPRSGPAADVAGVDAADSGADSRVGHPSGGVRDGSAEESSGDS